MNLLQDEDPHPKPLDEAPTARRERSRTAEKNREREGTNRGLERRSGLQKVYSVLISRTDMDY